MLKLNNVSKNFGGMKALHDVSFNITDCNIHALIGPNGAGKTTLFNLITGLVPLAAGEIYF